MKTVVQLKDERSQLNDKLDTRKKEIFALIESEKRGKTDSETQELEKIVADIRKLDVEITEAEARLKAPVIMKPERKEGNLLLRALRCAANGQIMPDDVQALVSKGREEMRNAGLSGEGITIPLESRGDYIQATVATDGKETIKTDVLDVEGALRDRLVLPSMGARYLTGLRGNIDIPIYSGTNVAWAGEVAAAANGKGEFKKVTMSPKRLTAYLDVSKQFLEQDTTEAASMLFRDAFDCVAEKFQKTVFGSQATSLNSPDGFFTGKVAADFAASGDASYAGIIDLEAAVDSANALQGNLGYITNAKGRGILKRTLRASNVAEGFIVDGNGLSLNGYRFASSNSVAGGLLSTGEEDKGQEGIIFGNWADFVIGQWGGIDILVDPYTQAANGCVRLVLNVYMDAVKKRAESFAIGALK